MIDILTTFWSSFESISPSLTLGKIKGAELTLFVQLYRLLLASILASSEFHRPIISLRIFLKPLIRLSPFFIFLQDHGRKLF
jgi:hypothetical protein